MHICRWLDRQSLVQLQFKIQLSQKGTLPGKDFPLQLCDNKCVTQLTQINAVITHKQVQTLLRRRCVHACKNNTSQLHKNGMLLFIRLDLFFDILFVLESVNVAYLLNSCQISHLFLFASFKNISLKFCLSTVEIR